MHLLPSGVQVRHVTEALACRQWNRVTRPRLHLAGIHQGYFLVCCRTRLRLACAAHMLKFTAGWWAYATGGSICSQVLSAIDVHRTA